MNGSYLRRRQCDLTGSICGRDGGAGGSICGGDGTGVHLRGLAVNSMSSIGLAAKLTGLVGLATNSAGSLTSLDHRFILFVFLIHFQR